MQATVESQDHPSLCHYCKNQYQILQESKRRVSIWEGKSDEELGCKGLIENELERDDEKQQIYLKIAIPFSNRKISKLKKCQ